MRACAEYVLYVPLPGQVLQRSGDGYDSSRVSLLGYDNIAMAAWRGIRTCSRYCAWMMDMGANRRELRCLPYSLLHNGTLSTDGMYAPGLCWGVFRLPPRVLRMSRWTGMHNVSPLDVLGLKSAW